MSCHHNFSIARKKHRSNTDAFIHLIFFTASFILLICTYCYIPNIFLVLSTSSGSQPTSAAICSFVRSGLFITVWNILPDRINPSCLTLVLPCCSASCCFTRRGRKHKKNVWNIKCVQINVLRKAVKNQENRVGIGILAGAFFRAIFRIILTGHDLE